MARSEPTRRVFLIGFMGAGKTSVGRALAARLGWKFCDLDNIIETREHETVAAIFANRGEEGFRKAESAALDQLLQNQVLQDGASAGDLVIALGGGTFAQPANRTALERSGAVTILLEAPLDELSRRCQLPGNLRPLARDAATFKQLFAARRSAYELAQHRVDTMNKSVERVAEEIERILTATKPEVKQ